MKCPKCKKEINNDANFCPYCGTPVNHQLKVKQNKSNKSLTYLLLILLVAAVPLFNVLIYSNYYKSMSTTYNSTSTELQSINGTATSVSQIYDTVESFESAYSNSSDYIKVLDSYESSLVKQYGEIQSSNCTIYVLNNNDVAFKTVYTFNYENMTVSFKRVFDTGDAYDENQYIFKTAKTDQFDELFFTDTQLSVIEQYASTTDLTNIEKSLKDRKDEFEEKKKTLGHFGLGQYSTNMSDIIKKDGTLYYKTLTVNSESTNESLIQ